MRAIVLVPALLGLGAPGALSAQEPEPTPPSLQIVDVPACRVAPANRRCALGEAILTPQAHSEDRSRYLVQPERYRLPADDKAAEIRLDFVKVTASMPF